MSLNRPIQKLKDWIDYKTIDWYQLSLNPNAIQLLSKNPDKIDWYYLSLNPSIFQLDYQVMRRNNEEIEEKLIKEVMISETETFKSL